jgi:hypothetical protein
MPNHTMVFAERSPRGHPAYAACAFDTSPILLVSRGGRRAIRRRDSRIPLLMAIKYYFAIT